MDHDGFDAACITRINGGGYVAPSPEFGQRNRKGSDMKLTVLERIALLGILPAEGNFVTLKIVRKLRESLSFEEDEAKKLNVRFEDGRIFWDAAAEEPEGKEIEIGEKATDLIVDSLKKLDKEGKLTEQHFSAFEKFVKE